MLNNRRQLGFLAEYGGGYYRMIAFNPNEDIRISRANAANMGLLKLGCWYQIERDANVFKCLPVNGNMVLPDSKSPESGMFCFKVAVPISIQQLGSNIMSQQAGFRFNSPVVGFGHFGPHFEGIGNIKRGLHYYAFVSLLSFNELPPDYISPLPQSTSTMHWVLLTKEDIVGEWVNDLEGVWFDPVQLQTSTNQDVKPKSLNHFDMNHSSSPNNLDKASVAITDSRWRTSLAVCWHVNQTECFFLPFDKELNKFGECYIANKKSLPIPIGSGLALGSWHTIVFTKKNETGPHILIHKLEVILEENIPVKTRILGENVQFQTFAKRLNDNTLVCDLGKLELDLGIEPSSIETGTIIWCECVRWDEFLGVEVLQRKKKKGVAESTQRQALAICYHVNDADFSFILYDDELKRFTNRYLAAKNRVSNEPIPKRDHCYQIVYSKYSDLHILIHKLKVLSMDTFPFGLRVGESGLTQFLLEAQKQDDNLICNLGVLKLDPGVEFASIESGDLVWCKSSKPGFTVVEVYKESVPVNLDQSNETPDRNGSGHQFELKKPQSTGWTQGGEGTYTDEEDDDEEEDLESSDDEPYQRVQKPTMKCGSHSEEIPIYSPNNSLGKDQLSDENGSAELAHIAKSDHMKKKFRKYLQIPRSLYPWIKGPYDYKINSIIEGTNVEVKFPDPGDNTIVISGECKDVEAAAGMIQTISNSKSRGIKTVKCTLSKSLHPRLIGQNNSGIHDILRDTDVVVEVPDKGDPSDVITLRGSADQIDAALDLVRSKSGGVVVLQAASSTSKAEDPMDSVFAKYERRREKSVPPEKKRVESEDQCHSYGQLSSAPPPPLISTVHQPSPESPANFQTEKRYMTQFQIPHSFYPWIRGPFDRVLKAIIANTKVEIKLPDVGDNVIISGEREGVDAAAKEIKRIHEAKRRGTKTIKCSVDKKYHPRLVANQNQQLILRDTDVIVEVPDKNDQSELITLRGPIGQIDAALVLVRSKSGGIVTVLEDLTKSVEHPLDAVFAKYERRPQLPPEPDTHAPSNAISNSNFVRNVEPTNDPPRSSTGKQIDRSHVVDLQKSASSKSVENRSSTTSSRSSTPSTTSSTARDENSQKLSVRSSPSSNPKSKNGTTQKSEKALEGMSKTPKSGAISKSEVTSVQLPCEEWMKKFFMKRESIQVLMAQNESVNIDYRYIGILKLKGTKEDIAMWEAEIREAISGMSFEVLEVPKEFRRNIVGVNGTFIKTLMENREVEVQIPSEYSTSDEVRIEGRKQDVIYCKSTIVNLVSRLKREKSEDIRIPRKHHAEIISKHIERLCDKFPNAEVVFPLKEDLENEIVNVHGCPIHVDELIKALKDLADKLESGYCEETLTVPNDHHDAREYISYVVGTNSSRLKGYHKKCPSVKIIFPDNLQLNRVIRLSGKKDEVDDVKRMMQNYIDELRTIVVEDVKVPSKCRGKFLGNDAKLLREIQSENGNCKVIFRPSKDSDDNCVVTVRGTKDHLKAAKKRIQAIVMDLETQIVEKFTVPKKDHRFLVPDLGMISEEFNVRIRVPDKYSSSEVIEIVGRDQSQILLAKNTLINLIHVTEFIHVPPELRGGLIGASGDYVNALKSDFSVQILIPPANKEDAVVKVTGLRGNVDRCIVKIQERLRELKINSFKLSIDIPSRQKGRLIGTGGSVVKQFESAYNVKIDIPQYDIPQYSLTSEPKITVTITGRQDNCKTCEAAILMELCSPSRQTQPGVRTSPITGSSFVAGALAGGVIVAGASYLMSSSNSQLPAARNSTPTSSQQPRRITNTSVHVRQQQPASTTGMAARNRNAAVRTVENKKSDSGCSIM